MSAQAAPDPPQLARDRTPSTTAIRWLYACRGSRLHDYRPHAGDTCPSLAVTAARGLLRNLDRLDDKAFDALPRHVGRALLDAARTSDLHSIRAAQLLARFEVDMDHRIRRVDLSYPLIEQSKDQPYYQEQTNQMAHSLRNFQSAIPLLNSPDSRWTTSLYLAAVPLDLSSIMTLGRLRNLRYLRLFPCYGMPWWPQLDVRFMRNIARMSREQGSFPTLRGLVFDDVFEHDYSREVEEILSCSTQMPALRLLALPVSGGLRSDYSPPYPRPPWHRLDRTGPAEAQFKTSGSDLRDVLYRIESSSSQPPTAPNMFMEFFASKVAGCPPETSAFYVFRRGIEPSAVNSMTEAAGASSDVPSADAQVRKAPNTIRESKRRRLDDMLEF